MTQDHPHQLASLIAFLINCLVIAICSAGLTLFVRWLFEDWTMGIIAGVFMAVDGYVLAVFRFSPLSGKRF